jgi:hypothetical protein
VDVESQDLDRRFRHGYAKRDHETAADGPGDEKGDDDMHRSIGCRFHQGNFFHMAASGLCKTGGS